MLEFLKILRANTSLAIPHSAAFVLNPSIFPSISVTVLHLLGFMTLKLSGILSVHS